MGSPSEAAGPAGPFEQARAVVRMAESRRPSLGAGRLICVDGPAGSGKTTLAAAVADRTGATVIHLDDLMEGWSGMAGTGAQLRTIVEPLAEGEPGRYQHFNWFESRFDRTVDVPPAEWLVLEGVGSGHPVIARHITTLVWVETDAETRLRRGLDRDGTEMEPQWRRWMFEEETFHARQRTRERADVVILDGVLQ